MMLIITLQILMDTFVLILSYFYLGANKDPILRAIEILAIVNVDLVIGSRLQNFQDKKSYQSASSTQRNKKKKKKESQKISYYSANILFLLNLVSIILFNISASNDGIQKPWQKLCFKIGLAYAIAMILWSLPFFSVPIVRRFTV